MMCWIFWCLETPCWKLIRQRFKLILAELWCAWCALWNYFKSYFVLYLLVAKLCHKFTHVMIQLSKALTRPSRVKFTIFQWWPPPLPPDTVWDTRRENRRQKNLFQRKIFQILKVKRNIKKIWAEEVYKKEARFICP